MIKTNNKLIKNNILHVFISSRHALSSVCLALILTLGLATPAVAEDEDVAGDRVFSNHPGRRRSESVEGLPHVRDARREEDPDGGRKGQHASLTARITRVSEASSNSPGTRTVAPPMKSDLQSGNISPANMPRWL